MTTSFQKLNHSWNAEPNAPGETLRVEDDTVVLEFFVNAFKFPQFEEEDKARLIFRQVQKYRHGPTNDEGWSRNQCRFSQLAPEWGEFYEITGDLFDDRVNDWRVLSNSEIPASRYLFYLRDGTFECDAEGWEIEFIRPPVIRYSFDCNADKRTLPLSVSFEGMHAVWQDTLARGGILGIPLDDERWFYFWHEAPDQLMGVEIINEGANWSTNAEVDKTVASALLEQALTPNGLARALATMNLAWVSGPVR